MAIKLECRYQADGPVVETHWFDGWAQCGDELAHTVTPEYHTQVFHWYFNGDVEGAPTEPLVIDDGGHIDTWTVV